MDTKYIYNSKIIDVQAEEGPDGLGSGSDASAQYSLEARDTLGLVEVFETARQPHRLDILVTGPHYRYQSLSFRGSYPDRCAEVCWCSGKTAVVVMAQDT